MLGKLSAHLVIALVLYLLSSSAFAMRDFKCYIKLSNGKAVIANQFAYSASDAKKKILSYYQRNKQQKISSIEQCVKIQQEFSNYQALILDRATPQ